MTNELTLYQGGLINIPPRSGVDYPLKFKKDEGVYVSKTSGVGEFNPNDPKSGGELESWRDFFLFAIHLFKSCCFNFLICIYLLTFFWVL